MPRYRDLRENQVFRTYPNTNVGVCFYNDPRDSVSFNNDNPSIPYDMDYGISEFMEKTSRIRTSIQEAYTLLGPSGIDDDLPTKLTGIINSFDAIIPEERDKNSELFRKVSRIQASIKEVNGILGTSDSGDAEQTKIVRMIFALDAIVPQANQDNSVILGKTPLIRDTIREAKNLLKTSDIDHGAQNKMATIINDLDAIVPQENDDKATIFRKASRIRVSIQEVNKVLGTSEAEDDVQRKITGIINDLDAIVAQGTDENSAIFRMQKNILAGFMEQAMELGAVYIQSKFEENEDLPGMENGIPEKRKVKSLKAIGVWHKKISTTAEADKILKCYFTKEHDKIKERIDKLFQDLLHLMELHEKLQKLIEQNGQTMDRVLEHFTKVEHFIGKAKENFVKAKKDVIEGQRSKKIWKTILYVGLTLAVVTVVAILISVLCSSGICVPVPPPVPLAAVAPVPAGLIFQQLSV